MSSTSKTRSEYDLSPEQSRFVQESDRRYVGFVSGVGAGKTFAGIVRTIRNVLEWNPGSMGAIVAPARRMIVDVIIPEMRDMGLFDAPYNWEYKSAYSDEPGIHTPNGTRILMLSADNSRTIERLRGLNLAFWWMDEESAIDPRARQILMQRLRVGNYRNGYVTTTPKGKNHTYEFFRQGLDKLDWSGAGSLYADEGTLALVGVPTGANEFLPEDYQDAMQQDMSDEIRAQEIEGQFVEVGSGVYTRDTFTFIDLDDIKEDWRINYVLGVDPAVQADSKTAQDTDSDYWAVTLCGVHRPGNQIFAVDQKRERGMTLTEGAEWIAQIAKSANAKVLVESNQAQRWLSQELRDYNLQIKEVQSSRNKEEKLIGMSIPLENELVRFVNHEKDNQLGYDPRWQPLIQEALAFPEGSHDDLLDSLHIVVDNTDIHNNPVLSGDMYGRGDSNE